MRQKAGEEPGNEASLGLLWTSKCDDVSKSFTTLKDFFSVVAQLQGSPFPTPGSYNLRGPKLNTCQEGITIMSEGLKFLHVARSRCLLHFFDFICHWVQQSFRINLVSKVSDREP